MSFSVDGTSISTVNVDGTACTTLIVDGVTVLKPYTPSWHTVWSGTAPANGPINSSLIYGGTGSYSVKVVRTGCSSPNTPAKLCCGTPFGAGVAAYGTSTATLTGPLYVWSYDGLQGTTARGYVEIYY